MIAFKKKYNKAGKVSTKLSFILILTKIAPNIIVKNIEEQ